MSDQAEHNSNNSAPNQKVESTKAKPTNSATSSAEAPDAAEKKSYLGRFFFQSYKTPEEKKAEIAKAEQSSNKEDPDTLRKFFHDNFCQSISSKTPPPKPEPTPEELKRKEEEKRDKKPFTQRVKESFSSGESKTSKSKAKGSNTGKETEEIAPVQGPDPQPGK